MADHPGLLRAILDDPDDDVPRLIYADWLDDHGDPERAEFIRAQVDLAGLEECVHAAQAQKRRKPCRYCDLRRRERKLLSGHYSEWMRADLGALRQRLHWRAAERTYRRGFVNKVWCTRVIWLSYGRTVVRVAPVTRLELVDTEPVGLPGGLVALAPGPLPVEWYSRLRGQDGAFAAVFSGREAATRALGDAAIAWARHEVGLPSLH